ncbi:PAS domain S-box protein [Rubrivirga sp. S365]|uniref:PAS domain S-box protein n=1 Tax=Rubrivirga sp. S365 TaxID=3076080 RepID=UPI0028C7DF51|nr:PAS domain S-box protein [Rubrivirga sp. S365]MDT7856008.1 PAS domain S-box protein [Rubrivirga sp. S365]
MPHTPEGDAPDDRPAPESEMDASGALGPDRDPDASPFLVVGLGASAGGLEALEAFFAGLPKTDGAAFVVVIHLAPDRESQLAEILERSVPLPVTQVTEREEVCPGHVYVIPPNRNLVMEDGHLRLEPLEDERHRRRPIDHFFRTLAEAYGEHAVGVVLSGTGQNGTVGASRLQELGGLVLAQDPADAGYDEMPRSAIAAGVADTVGTAGQLAREAIAYGDRLKAARLPPDEDALGRDDVRAVQQVLALLRAQTGHDFAHYKRSTVLRRLARRMHVVGADSPSAYLDALRRTPGEPARLLDDLLISVTNFFRDPEAFEVLEAAVVPSLFEGKGPDDEVRVWVAGCATGEEAYSVAILLAEFAGQLAAPPRVQVFATDLSERAVAVGRAGVYPESIEADVSPERLRRFFRRSTGGYRVTEALRETVLFAPHSLLKDPPFAHLDLVTCRNLLIYLQRSLQQRVLELFHYALDPGGALFLGSSETADAASALYQAEDKDARLYRRRDVEVALPALPRSPRIPSVGVAPAPPARPDGEVGPSVSFADVHRRLRAEAAPPSVLVGETGEVVHLSGGAGAFLQMGSGEPTRNVLRLVLPVLRPSVQAALYQARREGGEVASGPVRVEVEGAERAVRVRARATAEGDSVQVLFETAPPAEGGAALVDPPDREAALQAEVQEVREQLQLSVEEFETSREELKAQNEELQSINEELRSTAEELETSKEEAQSMAEELQTVNDEMKAKVDELARAKGDLENLITSTEIATLFLDRSLRVQRFTPSVRDHFRLRPSDLGRPLSDFAPTFGGAVLADDARAVLDRLEVQEREVQGADGRWYLVHTRPYRTVDDRIDGVVVTFIDITARRQAEEGLRRSEEQFRALVEASAQIVWSADAEGRIVEDSPSWRAFTGQTAPEWEGEGWADAVHPDDRAEALAAWRRAVAAGADYDHQNRLRHGPSGTWRWTHTRATPLRDGGGAIRGYVGMNADVTEQREAAEALRAGAGRDAFRAALADALRPSAGALAVEGAAARVLGEYLGASRVHCAAVSADGATGTVRTDYHDGVPSVVGTYDLDGYGRAAMDEFRAGRTLVVRDVAADPRLGTAAREATLALDIGAYVLTPVVRDGRGVALFVVHSAEPRDWTDAEVALVEETAERAWEAVTRANAEADLRASEERYRVLVEGATGYAMFMTDAEGRVTMWNRGAEATFGVAEADALGRPARFIFTPEDRAAGVFEAELDTARETGQAADDRWHARADGSRFWANGVMMALRGEGGAVRGFAKVLRDNTAHKEAEDALRASEERFRRTAETVPDILFTADPDGRIGYVNPRFMEVTGQTADAALGTEMWEDLVHPDDRAAAEAVLDAGRGGTEPYAARYRMEVAGGQYRWFLTRAQPVRDDAGALTGWFGTVTDIDQIVQAEEEIQALNETLERRVRQRTALARRLLARLTVAEEEERRRIAQVLHDDLQQQLYGLSMTLSVLRQGGAANAPLLDRATATLDDAVALTRTLASELSPAVLRMEDVVEVFEWLAEHVRARYGLAVEVEVEPGCRIADRSTRATLYQVLREALFNVVKHADVERARLTARRDGGTVVVAVEDEGAGFDPEQAAGRGGTGLGLESVQGRLDLVGGRVEIDSSPGGGTRIAFVVPAERAVEGGAAGEGGAEA